MSERANEQNGEKATKIPKVLFNMYLLFLWISSVTFCQGASTCVDRFEYMFSIQFDRHTHCRICSESNTIFPRTQAVVINSFVDNKSMGVYVNLMFLLRPYSVSFDVCLNWQMNCFMASSINPPHNAACNVTAYSLICSRTRSLYVSSIFQ